MRLGLKVLEIEGAFGESATLAWCRDDDSGRSVAHLSQCGIESEPFVLTILESRIEWQ